MKTSVNFFTSRNKFLKSILLALSFIFFIPQLAVSQVSDINKNTLYLEWGNNIWGNSVSLGYNYHFTKSIYAGISLGTGYFRYTFDDNGSSFFIDSTPGKNNIFSMDFKQMIDLRFGFIFKQAKGLSIFNKFEAGISCNHFILADEYTDNYENLWKGSKEFTLYALLLNLEIINYKPKLENHMDFSFGIKSKFTVTGSQTLRYDSEGYLPRYLDLLQNGKTASTSYWAYPEFYLKINYSL